VSGHQARLEVVVPLARVGPGDTATLLGWLLLPPFEATFSFDDEASAAAYDANGDDRTVELVIGHLPVATIEGHTCATVSARQLFEGGQVLAFPVQVAQGQAQAPSETQVVNVTVQVPEGAFQVPKEAFRITVDTPPRDLIVSRDEQTGKIKSARIRDAKAKAGPS
jgi:hypothetical protein